MRTVFTLATVALCALSAHAGFNVGLGIGDCTSGVAEVNLMGYANPAQTSAGLLDRLYARTYIVQDSDTSVMTCFVTVDFGMSSQMVKDKVVAAVAGKFNGTLTDKNIMISGTHTHSSAAGFLQYVLFQVTSLGSVPEVTDAVVAGIVDSISMAYDNLQPGQIKWSWGEVHDANINRSPTSYLANPAAERAMYDANTDLNMTLLRFEDAKGNPVGMLNHFAVHGTSINNTNSMISSDNRGFASQHFELAHSPAGTLPGQNKFVAAFASSNLGDVSPNTEGPHCLDTGLPCDVPHSTCNGKNELCVASGPGKDMYESAMIIGQRQLDVAMDLFSKATTPLSGSVDYIHTYVDMTNFTVTLPDGSTAHTCKPAMGYAFAAGTTDGPGAFNFEQGTNTSNPFWNAIRNLIAKPTQAEVDCQKPKPILLPTGETDVPYAWDPSIVPFTIQRWGNYFLLGVPMELTTMAGRRLRSAVRTTVIANGASDDAVVIIAGLSNTYSSYCTTYEEFQVQRYEGASTVFGPHQLQAVIENFEHLAEAMMLGNSKSYPSGPQPPNLQSKQISLLPGVIVDGTPIGKSFGDVLGKPAASYSVNDTVRVRFQSANPRSHPRGATYLTVDKQVNGAWTTVFSDANWETRYQWSRPNDLSDESFADIEWTIPVGTSGTFRITHSGTYKTLFGDHKSFTGTTSSFTVTA